MIFIVDADIASSASENQHRVSANSRETLNEILSNGHKSGFCKKLSQEWKEHSSNYSRKWLSTMISKDKMHVCLHNNESQQSILPRFTIDEQRQACKDSHLLDNAIVTDNIILSNDTRARNHFRRQLITNDTLRTLYWLSSTNDFNYVINLIRHGSSPPENFKLLE